MVLKRFPLPAVIDRPPREVTVAATQMSLTWDLEGNMVKAEQLVRKAAAQGAQIILLQVCIYIFTYLTRLIRLCTNKQAVLKFTPYHINLHRTSSTLSIEPSRVPACC